MQGEEGQSGPMTLQVFLGCLLCTTGPNRLGDSFLGAMLEPRTEATSHTFIPGRLTAPFPSFCWCFGVGFLFVVVAAAAVLVFFFFYAGPKIHPSKLFCLLIP